MNKRGLTTIASTLIIIGMVVAIGIVFIIIYNIISSEIEYSTESNISLQIEKSSVVIGDDNKVSLKVSRGTGDAELEKIKFVLFDGENIEEIEKKASELEESSEMSFSFTPKLVTNIKTISVVPIIKVNGKRKYLAVANSITITKQESNGTVIAEIPTTICGNAKPEAGEQCDDGNLVSGDGCSNICKTEVTTTTADCGNGICNGTETCSSCSKDCGICSITSLCGNSVKDSGEECDLGNSKNTNTACATTYGINCSYCSISCKNITIAGSYCGDNTCQSSTETSTNCVGDCPVCSQGDTQLCSSGGNSFGTQTCGADKTWGTCVYSSYTLSFSKSGGASTGTVTSSPSGINCGTSCTSSTANFSSAASVTLTAAPVSGYLLSSWSGACSGTGTCSVTMSSAKSVTATFAVSTYALTVTKVGSGTITSSPSGINCGSTCSYNFNLGTSVVLTATPAAGNTFSGWSGACTGSGTCSLTMSEAKSIGALFSCTPATCSSLGKNCGSWNDGCGNTLSCGSCTSGYICSSGVCTACTTNCAGKQCGNDGCGGSCGSCPSGGTCNSNSICENCARNPVCGSLTSSSYFGAPAIYSQSGITKEQCLTMCNNYPNTCKMSCTWHTDGGCVLGSGPLWYSSTCPGDNCWYSSTCA